MKSTNSRTRPAPRTLIRIGSVRVIRNPLLQGLGNMLRKQPIRMLFLLPFTARHRLDMYFVRTPLDIIVLSEQWQVIEVFTLRPWESRRCDQESRKILELPAGEAQSLGITPGSTLEINATKDI
ncbi:MAG: hypothetical protein HC945_01115 [Nitrosarchaeum sp.]|nr:hypothetical protein [Nitrosarchaeum sp.]